MVTICSTSLLQWTRSQSFLKTCLQYRVKSFLSARISQDPLEVVWEAEAMWWREWEPSSLWRMAKHFESSTPLVWTREHTWGTNRKRLHMGKERQPLPKRRKRYDLHNAINANKFSFRRQWTVHSYYPICNHSPTGQNISAFQRGTCNFPSHPFNVFLRLLTTAY